MEQNKNLSQLIHELSFKPHERIKIFIDLPHEKRAEVILHLTRHLQHDIISRIPEEELLATVEYLDPDEVTDVIQLLPHHKQKKLIKKLNKELRGSVEILARFDPQTAAGIMNIDYIQVEVDDSIAEVAKQVKLHEKRTGRLPAIIAMREGKIAGYVPGHELGFAKLSENIKKYIRRISVIKHNAPHDEVIRIFKEHPHNKVAVTGDRGNILGIIYSDDILKLLNDRESASLYKFAGVSGEESVTDPASVKIRFRYRWLILNLATAFFVASVVGLFEETISKYVILAVYMPIVAGMGGNTATQTLAVLVRGITLRQIELKTAWKTLKSELGAGLVNGFITGFIAAVVVYFSQGDIKISLILASAMIINLLVATFFGTLVPLVMKRLGRDPATSATIFITTATDVLGFLAFLGLAAWILS